MLLLLLSHLLLHFIIPSIHSQIADIDRLQHDLSKFLSVSRYNESEKFFTRLSIKQAFEGVGLNSMTQSFSNDETNEIGSNVISIQQGPFYNTKDDRIVVLCANYDTLEDHPGVDDNGSGVALVLEAARAMATLDRLYKRQYTIIYALVDMKHKSLSGSHSFVEEVLLPIITRSNSTVAGVIVLDGVLHFDPFPSTQSVPDGFEELLPSAARELREHNHMGDFIQVTGRAKKDDIILQNVISSFIRASSMIVNDWSFRPWLLPLRLPFDDITSIDSLYKMHTYLFADHSAFLFHSNQDIDIPTVYVTDTLNRRGVRQYCPYCDGLYMLTDQNMRFLSLITDTVIRSLIQLSGSEASSIVDELHAFLFNSE